MEQRTYPVLPHIENPKRVNGYIARLLFAVFLIAIAVGLLALGIVCFALKERDAEFYLRMGPILTVCGVVAAAIAMFAFIGAVKGRTERRANTISIALGAVFAIALIGILGIVGGVRGKKAIDDPELDDCARKNLGAADAARYFIHINAVKAIKLWACLFALGSLLYFPFFTVRLIKRKILFAALFVAYAVTFFCCVLFVVLIVSCTAVGGYDDAVWYYSLVLIMLTSMLGLISLTTLLFWVPYVFNNAYVAAAEKEVSARDGESAGKAFEATLFEKAKADDADGFVAELVGAYDRSRAAVYLRR